MKKRLYISIISAGAILGISLSSCITKAPEEPDVTAPRIPEPIVSHKVMEIKVRFIGFELDDSRHYTFQDGLDKLWEFGGDEESHFDFGVKLPKEAANAENQGWTSNAALQGHWFLLQYVKRYQKDERGQAREVLIITQAKQIL